MLFYPETDRPRQRGEESRAGSSEMGSEQIDTRGRPYITSDWGRYRGWRAKTLGE